MATYFHGSSEFQAASAAAAAPDGMQTLFLMNPNYVPYSDTHQPAAAATNMFFLNPTSLPQAPPPNTHQRFLGLPLSSPPSASIRPVNPDDPHRPSPLHGIVPGFHSNFWGTSSVDHHNSPPPGGTTSHPQVVSAADNNNSGGSHDVAASQSGFLRPEVSPRQGLSLSLSSQRAAYRPSNNVETDIQVQQPQVPTMSLADDLRISGNSPSSVSIVSNGISGAQSVVLGSKYLRAAQELLDEVVNVGKGIKTDVSEGTKEKIKVNKEAVNGEGSSAAEDGTKRGAELTTAQRQELQMKKAKLISMLDEVEQRYRQYHHQMQIVVSSFELAAGFGAAKSYTAVASKTISKQFRCLKDAISGQIKATSKSLGEEDWLGARVEGSRLRYVDHQLRQQRALQQLGMVQHNAWRPQRGLPERAVSVLRAWLFEHFLHPYPKDSDKHMLAKQTGLTRSQVSNWFINARVRLWKPMVEEMYLEEVKEQEKNGSEANANANESGQKETGSSSNVHQDSVSFMMEQVKTQSLAEKSINHHNIHPTDHFSNSTSPMGASFLPQTAFNLIGSSDLDGAPQRSPKRPRGSSTVNDLQNSPSSILSMDMEMKQGEERLPKDSYLFLTATENPGDGFATYGAMGDIGRFNPDQLTPRFHGNSTVSLTLGLPHCENVSLSGNHHQNIQVGRRLELGSGAAESDFCGINNAQQGSHSTIFDLENRKRFAAQLLHDFVA